MRIFIALVLLSFTGCGANMGVNTTNISDLSERHDIDLSPDAMPEIDALIASIRVILATDSRTGKISPLHLIKVMPMSAADRSRLSQAYSQDMNVKCDEHDRCVAIGNGTPTEVGLQVRVGPISNPRLGYRSQVATKLYVRDDHTIESCNASGMYVKKLLVVKDVQGMLLSHDARSAKVTVNLENSTPFTCE